MYAFAYHRPESLEAAADLLGRSEDNKLLAGGMSLVPVMRHRLAHPAALIDLGAIPGLSGIAAAEDGIAIGATTTHVAVSRAPLVQRSIPALAHLAGGIGDPLVRNRGTIGGSLANNDPAACYPSAILALGATILTSERAIAADDFILGSFQTALRPSEIILRVRFPRPDAASYIKFANPSSRFSIVGVFLARRGKRVRIGVTGAGAHAFRPAELEDALSAAFSPEAARAVKVAPSGLISDIHASAEYRAHLIPELAAQAVGKCLGTDDA